MKKLITLLVVFSALTLEVNATKHTVTTSGSSYSPTVLTVHVGDTVTISASNTHPLVQVSRSTWSTNGTSALAGGWGSTNKNYTFTVSTTDTIYYVCSAHVSFGMKGRVVVAQFSGINEVSTNQLDVTVYPNPVTSYGTVRLSSAGNNPVGVYVYSINGQLEKDLSTAQINMNGDSYYRFDASNMPAGNHLILVSDGHSKIARKIQVVR